MKTQLFAQLSKYLETTPGYEPRDSAGKILSRLIVDGKDVEPDGPLPDYQSDNEPATGNGGGFSGMVPFKIPYGIDKKTGEQVPLTAICTVTLTVDDWGEVSIDGQTVVDLSAGVEAPGEYGGHQKWTGSGNIALSSGSHTLSYKSSNISLPHPNFNVAICDVSLSAAWEEDGGKIDDDDIIDDDDDDDDCDCDDSCSMSGGEPGGGSRAIAMGELGPNFTSSSAGRGVEASLEKEELRWNCNFGVLRGQGTPLFL